MAKKLRDSPVGLTLIEHSTSTKPPPVELSDISCRKERSRRSKTKFRCGFCNQACWAKPSASFVCGMCGVKMLPAERAP